ncbi:unnamed protein product [Pleuronectes platessa]|uniref:Uncharacterized protein n=1 Tax=Pleuronectes platessa TaxID=8262 RepID=A0A9N7YAJ6_PLEPL|nr:unnamed protein product [Pleuronectes platessa]
MEPCLEKEMVHHYGSGDGRGWGSLKVGSERWWWVGPLGVCLSDRQQYSCLASRWCGLFRFPRFPLTEPCLLTPDLRKRSGVGLPNLSSRTPPNTPLSTPSISAISPPSPLPPSSSIQGAESPRWQF